MGETLTHPKARLRLEQGLIAPGEYLRERLLERDSVLWKTRGRLLIFIMAVTSLLGAVVTFVAHNWTYLSTTGKLGLIGGLILISSALWVWRRFDGAAGTAFGIAATVFIGVWLAAAGQLYQAPGGVQKLLLNWAILSVPFALASKSHAHWLVWFGIAFAAFFSPPSEMLMSLFNGQTLNFQWLMGAVIPALGYLATFRGKHPVWFKATLAAMAGVLLVSAAIFSLFDWDRGYNFLGYVLAIGGLAGLCAVTYARKHDLTSMSLLTVGLVTALAGIVIRLLAEIKFDEVGIFGLIALTFGGFTFALVQCFRHYLKAFPQVGSHTSADIEDGRPWYMDVFIAGGGILTAIMGALFAGSFLGLILAMANMVGPALIVLGAGIYVGALLLRRKATGLFTRYLFGTFILIGGGMLIGGFAMEINDQSAIAVLVVLLSAVTAFLVRERVMEAIMAIIFSLAVSFLVFENAKYLAEYIGLALFGTMAIAAMTVPAGRRVFVAAGAIFLIAAMACGIIDPTHRIQTEGLPIDWSAAIESGLIRAIILGAFLIYLKAGPLKASMPPVWLLVVVTLIAAILPAGGAAAVLMLVLGHALGSRVLALIGALASIWFLFSAYFDLRLTLMELSAIMALCGAVFLGMWFALSNTSESTALEVSP